MTDRAAFFIDGYNLYIAINNLGGKGGAHADNPRLNKHYFKWLDFQALGKRLIRESSEELAHVVYCFSYAEHIQDENKKTRHREYVKALEASDVECIPGKFREKPVECHKCGHSRRPMEEKETDVNLAVHLIDGAHRNEFEHAYIVSADSDFAGAVRLFRERFPDKKITSVAPPGMSHPNAVKEHASGVLSIKEGDITACLFPETVKNKRGAVVAVRPEFYAPPDDADDDE